MAKAPKAKAKAKKSMPAKKPVAKKPLKTKAKSKLVAKTQPKKKQVTQARGTKKTAPKKLIPQKKAPKALKKVVKAVKKVAKPVKKPVAKPVVKAKSKPAHQPKAKPALQVKTKPVATVKPVVAKPVAAKPVASAPVQTRFAFTQPPVAKAPKPVVTKPVKPAVKPVIPATISASYHPTDGETYMSPTMLAFFRNQLLKWRAELEMESQEAIRELQETTAFQPDMNDQASLEYDQGLELRTRDRERKLIQKIDEALERIEDGSYGYCVETGEPIGVKRLLARPVATLSIEAKTLQEREEKGYAG